VLPFVIAAVVIVHIWALHVHSSNNPLGIDIKGPQDTLPFHPYYTTKDLVGLGVFLLVLAYFVFYDPNYMGHPDNYIPANPMATPAHIVPEWYFLPFYAILRALPDKLGGVILMFAAVAVLFVVPWLDTSRVRSSTFRPIYKQFFWILVIDCIVLGWIGANPAEGYYVLIGRIATAYYFAHFLIVMPLVGWLETPRPLPDSIAQAVLDKARKPDAAKQEAGQ